MKGEEGGRKRKGGERRGGRKKVRDKGMAGWLNGRKGGLKEERKKGLRDK